MFTTTAAFSIPIPFSVRERTKIGGKLAAKVLIDWKNAFRAAICDWPSSQGSSVSVRNAQLPTFVPL